MVLSKHDVQLPLDRPGPKAVDFCYVAEVAPRTAHQSPAQELGFFVSTSWVFPMDPTDGNPFGWFTAGGIGLMWAFTWLRKAFSSSGASIANDRAEKDMLERMLVENEKLRVANEVVSKERNEMYRQVGELTGAMKAMNAQLEQQDKQIVRLTEEVARLRSALEAK